MVQSCMGHIFRSQVTYNNFLYGGIMYCANMCISQIAQLRAQLDVSRAAVMSSQERIAELEIRATAKGQTDGDAQAKIDMLMRKLKAAEQERDNAREDSKDANQACAAAERNLQAANAAMETLKAERSSSASTARAKVETLMATVASKERENQALKDKLQKLADQNNASDSETVKVLNYRLESTKKRNEEQAMELGRYAARVEGLEKTLKDKEGIAGDYKSMIDAQTSQLSVMQSQFSAMQAEMESLKILSDEQSGFVDKLNEENAKLVSEIQRLKKQAVARDQQLHESVTIAKAALMKEKQKMAKLQAQLRQTTSAS
eukprot:m.1039703 g.1039703  ORF g.1039703 m.1039703 type:complete len:318 (+) comp24150_c2_seq1:912-1865(+)